MRILKNLLCLILTLTMMLSLGACGTKNTSTPAENKKIEGTESKEKITLKFVGTELRENYDKDVRVKAYFDAIDEFQKQNPNIVIEHEGIPHDAYQEKIQVLAAANELPDMFDVKGSWNKNFVNNGLVADLTNDINADQEWKSIIKQDANLNFQVDGKTYGLSIESGGSTSLVFYNEAILKECGINEFPKTTSDLYDAIEKIKAKGYTPISMGNKGKWLAESCYLSTIGNRFTGTEWTTSIINGTGAKFTDKDFVDSLSFFQNLAKAGTFNSDLNSIDYKQQRVPYYNKKAAMIVEGFWTINAILSDAPEDVLKATKIAVFPHIDEAKGPANMTTGGAGGWAKGISSKLEGPARDAAIECLKLYISKESANILYAGGIIPGMKSEDYDKDSLHRLQLDYFEIMDNITPCEVYDLTFDPAVEAVLENGLQELLIDAITPEKLAQKIQEEYEKTVLNN